MKPINLILLVPFIVLVLVYIVDIADGDYVKTRCRKRVHGKCVIRGKREAAGTEFSGRGGENDYGSDDVVDIADGKISYVKTRCRKRVHGKCVIRGKREAGGTGFRGSGGENEYESDRYLASYEGM